jgi:hypothetical protein
MRFSRVVPLLPLASALVITDADVFQNIEKSGKSIINNAQNVLDDAFGKANDAYGKVKDEAKNLYTKVHDAGCDVDAWLQGSSFDDSVVDFEEDHDHPHHPPPHHGPPHHGKPHHPPHDDKPNRTVYEVSPMPCVFISCTNLMGSSSARASTPPSLQSLSMSMTT